MCLGCGYNRIMPRVLYTAFDIVPSPKGASTHILHNIRGLVNSQFDVHLVTPNDGLLPDFLRQYPQVRIELNLSDRLSSLATEGFDLAIRYGPDGRIHPDILDAYWRHGFYVFEGVLKPDELADVVRHSLRP